MIRHPLFANGLKGNFFYLLASIFEILRQRFIVKPPACRGGEISIDIYELLLLNSLD